jgi:hypothetical protein
MFQKALFVCMDSLDFNYGSIKPSLASGIPRTALTVKFGIRVTIQRCF